ncbi:ThiF family adenylyltransferase [Streptomyces kutzneri]|uniref:ThiF family adenylyltransferase n=1 Tax=Streptomyces kutzneri TaxID=3051179 RepID=UPI0028D65B1B|nr:ThiF family adenylyltransferase [Streptomyces sp. DSM 40907]
MQGLQQGDRTGGDRASDPLLKGLGVEAAAPEIDVCQVVFPQPVQDVTERTDPVRPAREHLGHPVGDSGQVIRPEKAVSIGVEQRRLLGRRVGVIGLSVGGSAALTFAMEGIGGSFKLADFDCLSVSNLNRLRAGVHHLGLNKCVLAARQMLEIDPWLDIELYQGVV